MNHRFFQRTHALIVLFLFIHFSGGLLFGQQIRGSGVGTVLAESNRKPLEMVNVILRMVADSAIVTGNITDGKGRFEMHDVPGGRYFLTYSMLGFEEERSTVFALDESHPKFEAGTVLLKETSLSIGEVTVTANKSALNTSIDRKVYNVQQDIMSKTGTASDLLQHVPSVQVDIDGGSELTRLGQCAHADQRQTLPAFVGNEPRRSAAANASGGD
jgi:hypothetical protein